MNIALSQASACLGYNSTQVLPLLNRGALKEDDRSRPANLGNSTMPVHNNRRIMMLLALCLVFATAVPVLVMAAQVSAGG